MEYFVPCPCDGKETPCYSCVGTGKIGPLSVYEYMMYYDKERKKSMIKSQKVVRTFPKSWTNSTKKLTEALDQGWIVVMSNPFDCGDGTKGMEYILEKVMNEGGKGL
ncbi:hypothetical protein GJU40_01595 [Bacillus lacus]|uniref:Uncharacterized protein n=1 Tax=Metabacillus lacus TaxID=1983721 RepID=A0A7X2IW74_9BACI|nr:hypothetical protein [Metabacillus lacus]MRX70860.1 hypothetical protein [Metabacillus lacus]